jgi:hypothetical protein
MSVRSRRRRIPSRDEPVAHLVFVFCYHRSPSPNLLAHDFYRLLPLFLALCRASIGSPGAKPV